MSDTTKPEPETEQEQLPTEPATVTLEAEADESGFLKKAFNVAGTALSGSLLTTGLATFSELGDIWTELSLTEQFISTSSTMSGHMAVWSVAIAFGTAGWAFGKKFDNESAKFKPRALAAGIGLSFIAATYAAPLNYNIQEAVEGSLRSVFGAETITAPVEPYIEGKSIPPAAPAPK